MRPIPPLVRGSGFARRSADHLIELDAAPDSLDLLQVHADPADAAALADLVIESGPERRGPQA